MPVFGSKKSAAPPPKPAPAAARRKSDAGADLLWQAQLNADAKRQDALAKKPAEPHRGPTSGGAAAARARPKSLAETMASLDQLKDLAKSQNPVVVSCREQPPNARWCISHPGLLTLAPTRCSGLLGPAEPCRGRVPGADQRGDHRLAAPR